MAEFDRATGAVGSGQVLVDVDLERDMLVIAVPVNRACANAVQPCIKKQLKYCRGGVTLMLQRQKFCFKQESAKSLT